MSAWCQRGDGVQAINRRLRLPSHAERYRLSSRRITKGTGMESSDPASPLTEEQRSELKRISTQLDESASFLNELLGGWNHGGVTEYDNLQEAAQAAERAHEASGRID
jgi:hypothetical protein